ncbi:MAG: PA domain-containing protein, partial [Candidatus Eisenbacteria bacterium]
KRALAAPALLLATVLLATPAQAGFVIVNLDAPGVGFNDPTPAAPVGGNTGTTVGQQRLNVFVQAGQIWDAILQSPITIRVQAQFDSLPCTATGAVLGGAGANVLDSDFANAGFAATWYTGAEANRLAGTDLDPGANDIDAIFNSHIGRTNCLTGRPWYYGFDGNEGPSAVDFLPVLLHEIGHGLGFYTTTDESNGQYFAGLPSVFDRYLLDSVSGKHWYQMTPAERQASALNSEQLVWDGPAVNAARTQFLGPGAHVVTSGALTADYPSGQGVFFPPLTNAGTTGQVVLVNDGVGTASDGCNTPFVNAASVSGRIALVDRSATCAMPVQALNAQANGAIGVIIINSVAGPEPPIRGASPTVLIPVASVSHANGNALRAALLSGTVTATLALEPSRIAGVQPPGRVRMYAPNPVQPGSSVSHFDVSAFPNLLMEPAINPDLGDGVDLTFHAFYDIGWFPQLVGVPGAEPHELAFSHAPNPARDGGVLRFRLPAPEHVELELFDVSGRRVAVLANGILEGGEHRIRWDGRDAAGQRVGAGVYQARLRAGHEARTVSVVRLD